ncbi:RpnC/YadD family protein [Rickettsia endosymbiont of Urophora cardui]|uniref:transposase n=1 Tax=Rickettsia endosymbiont of Urophora cardui TaxID=3066265 RepID=UPI00313EDBC4
MTSLAHHWEQQGVEKGIQQGMQLGKAEGRYEVAKNMLSNNYSIAEVSRITGLSIDAINKLR